MYNNKYFMINDFSDIPEAFFWFGAMSSGMSLQETEKRLGKKAKMKSLVKAEEVHQIHQIQTEQRQIQIQQIQQAEQRQIQIQQIQQAEQRQIQAQQTDVDTETKDECILDNLDDTYFVIFDTETTGISRKDVVIQMCYLICNKEGSTISTYNRYWKKPCGIHINPRAFDTHKIDASLLQKSGYDAKEELQCIIKTFCTLKEKNILIVAHNANFDNRMLNQTCESVGLLWPFSKEDFFCTMKAARDRVGALDKNGKIKAPSNLELYKFVTGKEPEGNLHDALVDCRVTSVGFLKGREYKWW